MAEKEYDRRNELYSEALMSVDDQAQSTSVRIKDETRMTALIEEKNILESINGKKYHIYQVELTGDQVGVDEDTREVLTGRNTHVLNHVSTKQDFDLWLKDISARDIHNHTIERPVIDGHYSDYSTSEHSRIIPDTYKVYTLDNGKAVVDYGAVSLDRIDSKYTATDAEKVKVVRQYLGLTKSADEVSVSDSRGSANELRAGDSRILEQHNISKNDIDNLADSKRIEHKQKEKIDYSY